MADDPKDWIKICNSLKIPKKEKKTLFLLFLNRYLTENIGKEINNKNEHSTIKKENEH